MHDVSAALEERGYDRSRIVVERFTTERRDRRGRAAAKQQAQESLAHVSVLVDGTVREFDVRKGRESVLDAGLRSGVDLPYSCKSGICSSCRAQLVAGEVDMDVHFALEDYEVRSGVVLMCQSHPVTGRVELDVDAIAAQLI